MFTAKRTNALGHGKTYKHAVARTAKKSKFPITEVQSQVYLKNSELVFPRHNGRVRSTFLQIKGKRVLRVYLKMFTLQSNWLNYSCVDRKSVV